MAQLIGEWKIESSENFDEYMKVMGVGMVTRKLGQAAKPTTEIKQDGDTWTIATFSTMKNTLITFKLGEEFEETTADGRKVKTTVTAEGDTKLIQSQKAEIPSVITRELRGAEMVLTCEAKGVVATRVYKKK